MSLDKNFDIMIMLKSINDRLAAIELILKTKIISTDYNYLDSVDTADTPMIYDNHIDSDNEYNLLIDESYDSDNDRPIEKIEVYPESKLTLTPLQIQLANEEFMYYKNQNNEESEL